MARRLVISLSGATFIIASSVAQAENGIASVYFYSGSRTASGERTDPTGMTAAHRTLPFGTQVRVTNRRNGKSVVVRINDRGPFLRGRVIDVTPAAARALGFSGLAPVSIDSPSGFAAFSLGGSSVGGATNGSRPKSDATLVLAKD
jgi:rare lipoprotein A